MTPKVFLHYTQAELDRNYDQRTWCPFWEDYVQRYKVHSADFRLEAPVVTFRYGMHPDQTLDLFSTVQKYSAPTALFIHGGAWKNFTKDDYSFVGEQFVRYGVNIVVVNFSKLPLVRLPQVVDQLKECVRWLIDHASVLGIDLSRFYLFGYSSGAHMAAVLASSMWGGRYKDPFCGCALLSGSFDLRPAVLSARGDYLKLTPEEIVELSPIDHSSALHCPIVIACAEMDTDEFRRQSYEYAREIAAQKKLKSAFSLRRQNHFSIVGELANEKGDLFGLLCNWLSDEA